MQNKIKKDYRLRVDVLQKLGTLQGESGKSQTALIEGAVEYVFGEYLRATKGMDHDELALCQVLGKAIEKAG